MDITSLGHASFKVRAKLATIITDPYLSDMVGLKFPKNMEADIITISHQHQDHNAVQNIAGNPFVVAGPGEYEIKGVHIVGTPSFHDGEKGEKRGSNTIYHIEMDGVRLAHLGDLGHTLSVSDIEQLGEVDILFIPVGGVFTIDAKQAVEVINEIEPTIVIPMHYGRPELNQETFGTLAPLAHFLKEMGKEGVSPQPKLSITKDKLPEELQVVVLE